MEKQGSEGGTSAVTTEFYQTEDEYAMLVNLIMIGYDTKSDHQFWDFARAVPGSIAEANFNQA